MELKVGDLSYAEAVKKAFGTSCCYCGRDLEHDRAAVEHLDGMNRIRVGLHIPGNVILACTRCNREKRRDDSKLKLTLAETGWESFLSHSSKNCTESCNSCSYWKIVWPDAQERAEKLNAARDKIKAFRVKYIPYLELNAKAKAFLDKEINAIYRDCQEFATTRIKEAIDDVVRELASEKPRHASPSRTQRKKRSVISKTR
jgi:hypothetical protein